MSESKSTSKYRYCNHYHKLTDEHEIVDFGDGEFVANKMAIPLLKALANLGLRTRTHHIEENGGFFSILIDPRMSAIVRQVNEESDRSKYNGLAEVLFSFDNSQKNGGDENGES